MCRKLCPIPRRHQQKCMEHTPPQAWPVHRSANPAVEEVEQARTGGCKRLGHNIIPVTSTTAGWGSSCGPHSAPEGSLRDSLRIRFCQLLAAPLPAGTAEGRPSAPSSGGMRRTNPPHLGRNLFRDRAGLHSLAYRLSCPLPGYGARVVSYGMQRDRGVLLNCQTGGRGVPHRHITGRYLLPKTGRQLQRRQAICRRLRQRPIPHLAKA